MNYGIQSQNKNSTFKHYGDNAINGTYVSLDELGEVSVPDVKDIWPFEHRYSTFINLTGYKVTVLKLEF